MGVVLVVLLHLAQLLKVIDHVLGLGILTVTFELVNKNSQESAIFHHDVRIVDQLQPLMVESEHATITRENHGEDLLHSRSVIEVRSTFEGLQQFPNHLTPVPG